MTDTNPSHKPRDPNPVPADLFPEMVCRLCLEPVIKFGSEDSPEATWRHGRSGESDHEVDPIPRAEAPTVNYFCDFCGTPDDVVWVYPTRQPVNQIMAAPTYTGKQQRRQIGKNTFHHTAEAGPAQDLTRVVSSPRWSACGACATLIDIPDRERVIQRMRQTDESFALQSRNFLRNYLDEFFRTKLPREPLTHSGHTEENP